jgi:hypothetical protein
LCNKQRKRLLFRYFFSSRKIEFNVVVLFAFVHFRRLLTLFVIVYVTLSLSLFLTGGRSRRRKKKKTSNSSVSIYFSEFVYVLFRFLFLSISRHVLSVTSNNQIFTWTLGVFRLILCLSLSLLSRSSEFCKRNETAELSKRLNLCKYTTAFKPSVSTVKPNLCAYLETHA